ncbi:cell division protein FtsL [Candidatus Methylospira mobilis]|uniref:Cell division protein FtsL n=1 Tax=Candidatus Methylospira mobilis TaxID=1808979 RepID=A0A5Q0BEU5_9GAMM|nr:cell division protein FtsL [Candidatus Methylospira mobilis]QFY42029.1 cell division protein FtsL [Candidatus Methylospira mobilis]WNV03036.1 cell division protein FtsL [Candidatus Methylospira mobilis]
MKFMMFLLLMILASAMAVVHAKYRSRMLFAEVQRIEQELEGYEVEWGLLQLEQNTWAEHSRIEGLARSKLGMALPSRNAITYVKP